MAIFEGEDIVPVTTPDGRTLQLPRSLVPASMMPQPAQAPIGVPAMQPAQEYGTPVLPSPDAAPAVVEMGEPTVQNTAGTGIVEMGEPTVVSAAQLQKQAAAQQRQAASPQGQQASAEAQVQGALGSEKDAVANAANVEAAAQDLLGVAEAEHNAKLDDLAMQKAQAAQANFEAEEKKNREIEGYRKKISSTKIDRSVDHPILAALSMAVAGFGSAMKGESTNPALDLFWKVLDRKVANQMADLDLMEKTYGMQKDELAALKDKSGRKLELYNVMIAGEADKAKRHLGEIIAKSASEKTRAGAKMAMAQIDQRAAAAHQDALRWGLDYDFKEKAEKNQQNRFYAGLKQSDQHHNDDVQLRREAMYLDWQKYLGNLKSTGNDAEYKAKLELTKENRQLGLRNTITGDPLLTKQGRALMEQAKQMEAEAAALEETGKADPLSFSIKGGKSRVDMMREKASQMRGEATLAYQVKHRDPNQAGQLSDQYSSAQNLTQLVDEIRDTAERSYASTDAKRAAVQAKVGLLAVALKDAWQLGAWDKGSAGLVEKVVGGDPTKGLDANVIAAQLTNGFLGTDPEGYKKRLGAIVDDAQNNVFLKMRATDYGGTKDELFLNRKPLADTSTSKAASAISQGQTPTEVAAGLREAGPLSVVTDRFRFISREDKARSAEERGSIKYPGLDTGGQEQGFDTLLKSYKTGNVHDGDILVANVANAANTRPELAVALAHNLQEHAPDLYTKMRAQVPKGSKLDEQLTYEETHRIGAAQMPTPSLHSEVLSTLDENGRITNQESFAELSRRAATDKDAAKAVLDIVRQSTANRTLPPGSVFRGGR